MICFFTSDPILDNVVNPANGLLSELRQYIAPNANVLYVCSDPEDCDRTDFYSGMQKVCFENSGFSFQSFQTLDNRNREDARRLAAEANFIILAGGHVPTQNQFLREIDFKSLLRSFNGTLLGISAGTMNSAETVYVHPEREGEAVSKTFLRFRGGLGLTKHMILPHYQIIKDDILDGLRVFEDIAYPDSMGREFYALVDGSYILSCEGSEKLYGEAYLIKDGVIRQITSEGDILQI